MATIPSQKEEKKKAANCDTASVAIALNAIQVQTGQWAESHARGCTRTPCRVSVSARIYGARYVELIGVHLGKRRLVSLTTLAGNAECARKCWLIRAKL